MAKQTLESKPGIGHNYVWFMLVALLVFVAAFALLLSGISGTNFAEHGALIQIITFFLAFMPILLVLIGMLGFNLSALKVAPFAFLLAELLSYTFFANMERGPVELAQSIWAQTWSGIKSSFYIVGLILFSFLILDMMQTSGAMDIVKGKLAEITGGDRRVQLIIIGLFVPIFMEGAAGTGTPAAIAAPFLVGLGFEPVLAVVVALMSDGVCTSFGGSGLTTMSGGQDLVAAGVWNTDLNFAAAGVFHMIGILVMPFLILLFAYGKKAFKGKGIVGYSLFCGVLGALLMLIFSNFIGGFVTDMGTGLIGIVLAILGLRLFKIETPEELYSEPPKIEGKSLTEGIEIPRMVKVRQTYPDLDLPDPVATLQEQLDAMDGAHLRGMRIGISAGSRGLPHYKEILKALCDQLKAWGAKPFIFPAMGSHAGTTAEGQKRHRRGRGRYRGLSLREQDRLRVYLHEYHHGEILSHGCDAALCQQRRGCHQNGAGALLPARSGKGQGRAHQEYAHARGNRVLRRLSGEHRRARRHGGALRALQLGVQQEGDLW